MYRSPPSPPLQNKSNCAVIVSSLSLSLSFSPSLSSQWPYRLNTLQAGDGLVKLFHLQPAPSPVPPQHRSRRARLLGLVLCLIHRNRHRWPAARQSTCLHTTPPATVKGESIANRNKNNKRKRDRQTASKQDDPHLLHLFSFLFRNKGRQLLVKQRLSSLHLSPLPPSPPDSTTVRCPACHYLQTNLGRWRPAFAVDRHPSCL